MHPDWGWGQTAIQTCALDGELNPRPSSVQAGALTTEPRQQGHIPFKETIEEWYYLKKKIMD